MLAAGESPSAVDAQESLEQLNKLAFQWEAKNVYTGWIELALDDDFPLEAKHELGVEAMLAECLQAHYGNSLNAYGLQMAREGWNLLYADYHAAELLRTDEALQGMGDFPLIF